MSALAQPGRVVAPLEGLSQPARGIATFAVLSAMTLVVLDAGIANIALPTLSRAFRVEPADALLVVTAYQAALVMALLPAGLLGERLGYSRLFRGGVALFAMASIGCALATSLPWLVAARLVQGLGGAAILSLGVALLRFTVPRQDLGRVLGWNALTVALASAAAPSLGSMILSVANWPALFALSVPLAAITLTASQCLPRQPGRAVAIDLTSMALNGVLFGLLVLAGERATSDPATASALFGGALLAALLLFRRESPKSAPLVPLDLLAIAPFRISVVASICCFAGQSAGLLALPFLLQESLGQTPLAAGFYLTAWPLGVACAAPFAGRLAETFTSARLCALGGALLAMGMAGAAGLPASAPPIAIVPILALAGVGFGLFQTPNNRTMFFAAPAERSGAAGGLQGTARVTGQILGALAMGALFSVTLIERAPRLGLVLGAVLALIAGAISLLQPGRRMR